MQCVWIPFLIFKLVRYFFFHELHRAHAIQIELPSIWSRTAPRSPKLLSYAFFCPCTYCWHNPGRVLKLHIKTQIRKYNYMCISSHFVECWPQKKNATIMLYRKSFNTWSSSHLLNLNCSDMALLLCYIFFSLMNDLLLIFPKFCRARHSIILYNIQLLTVWPFAHLIIYSRQVPYYSCLLRLQNSDYILAIPCKIPYLQPLRVELYVTMCSTTVNTLGSPFGHTLIIWI